MVYFDVLPPHTPGGLLQVLDGESIRVGHPGGRTFRAVTHIGIARADIERVVSVLRRHFG
jgi:hypothetical protein